MGLVRCKSSQVQQSQHVPKHQLALSNHGAHDSTSATTAKS
jgi:hypothetical protein